MNSCAFCRNCAAAAVSAAPAAGPPRAVAFLDVSLVRPFCVRPAFSGRPALVLPAGSGLGVPWAPAVPPLAVCVPALRSGTGFSTGGAGVSLPRSGPVDTGGGDDGGDGFFGVSTAV